MSYLKIDTPSYNDTDDPTKLAEHTIINWTIHRQDVLALEKIFKSKCKGLKKKRSLIKNKRNNTEIKNHEDDKSKIIKLEIKQEIDPSAAESKPINRNGISKNALLGNEEKSTNNTNVIFLNGITDCTEIIAAKEDTINPDNNDAYSEDNRNFKSELKVESSNHDKVNTTEQMSTNDVIIID